MGGASLPGMSAVGPDTFGAASGALDSPAAHAASITPSDTNDLAHYTRGIYVGATGDLQVIMVGGETVTFKAVPSGATMPIRCTRVLAGATTATQLVAMW